MRNLSVAAILEKNKLSSDGAWLVLLEIAIGTTIIRICRNTEDIIWNGQTWIAFPFELEDVSEDSKGELPQVTVKVSNVLRTIQRYLEESNGGIGASVTLRVVHSEHLDLTDPEIEETFTVVATKTDTQWVYFILGGDDPSRRRVPERRYLKDFCPFTYGGIECGVSAAVKATYPACNKTLAHCRQRGNSVRFGGEPAIPAGGIYA
ncbi:MAG: DUF1833 family protein [Negativicutes bacterium]|nr:DUF1833 family protein [Negativicutes bacterium]